MPLPTKVNADGSMCVCRLPNSLSLGRRPRRRAMFFTEIIETDTACSSYSASNSDESRTLSALAMRATVNPGFPICLRPMVPLYGRFLEVAGTPYKEPPS